MDAKPTELETAEAVRWHERLRAEDCTPADRRAFQSWLARSPGNARAMERLRRLSGQMDILARQDPRMRELAAAALRERVNPPQRMSQWRVAAALVLGIGLAAMMLQRTAWVAGPGISHYTNSGLRQQVIDLPDGSRVHLDVGAQLDVQMGSSERVLELQEGRAFFEVAHDASRPFSVNADEVRTVALGTRFEVSVEARGVTVTLAEGSVAVSKHGPDGWKEVLKPGQQVQSRAEGHVRQEVNVALVAGWSTGRLVFRGAPLSEVLEEINRYASVKLRLGDESLGELPVGGTFIAGADSAQVAAALVAALPLSVVQDGAREIVLFRRYDAAE